MVRDTPSHGSDHLCLIWKESIHNCRWYRADTACGTDGRTDGRTDRRTDGQTDGRTEWNQYTLPTTSLCGGYNKDMLWFWYSGMMWSNIVRYYPLYTNWPITNTDLPHVIIQYILYFICLKLYWTVSGQLSNIGYIGQFRNEATGTLRTRYRRTKAMSMYLMKILSIFLHLRKILICFRIGWFL